MKRRLVVGNWKENPSSLSEAKELLRALKKKVTRARPVEVYLAVPHAFLHTLTGGKKNGRPLLGVQDISAFWGGAHTGEVAASMVKSIGGHFSIVGHSERRSLGETNEMVNKKVLAALGAGLHVVLCIGEEARDPEGVYLTLLTHELETAFQDIFPRDLGRVAIAYEPIFAIGKSGLDAMKGDDVHEMIIFIRKFITERFNRSRADSMPVLYGGSVDSTNAKDLLTTAGVDGFLLGRASLEVDTFFEIVRFARQV